MSDIEELKKRVDNLEYALKTLIVYQGNDLGVLTMERLLDILMPSEEREGLVSLPFYSCI